MCKAIGSPPSPEVLSKSPSPAFMSTHVDSADAAAPGDGIVGQDRPGESVRIDHDDAPVAVPLETCEFPDEISSVCVALEAQPHQSSTLVRGDFQDENWLRDRDAVISGSATLMPAGDHSRSSSGHRNSLIHEPSRAGRGATIAEERGGACKESGTCDSSDDGIVCWPPKRARVRPLGSASAERRDSGQPSMKRQRRRTHIAEPASRSARRHRAATPSRSQNNIPPTSTSTQEEWPVSPRALEFASEPTWEVDRIVGTARRHGKFFYKVQWEPTWEPAESLEGSADAAVAEFRSSNRRRRVAWSTTGFKQELRSFRIRT
ncbi:hypothetical protein LTS09_017502 [Friedmanniomyces endolithicus]|nr:hypothetical protein LTS09_017502 [Friedmanniomyces endolithicus]